MPPKKKQKVKRVAKIKRAAAVGKQKVKVTQNVIVNVGKGVAKRKKSNVISSSQSDDRKDINCHNKFDFLKSFLFHVS